MIQDFNDILFIGFSINLILACLLTVTAYNSVAALIALVFAFINTTCIFFLMELEFIGLLFLIVYVGAISVLFLFSVMLFNLKEVIRSKTTSFILKNIMIYIIVSMLLLTCFQYFIHLNDYNKVIDFSQTETIYKFLKRLYYFHYETYTDSLDTISKTAWYNDILPNHNSELYYLGQVLYSRYSIYLILTSIILLIAMVGAVILINNPKEQIQMQHAIKQITRSVKITNLN